MADVPPFSIGACMLRYLFALVQTSDALLPVDKPFYDQSTYYGRWRQFVELVSPR